MGLRDTVRAWFAPMQVETDEDDTAKATRDESPSVEMGTVDRLDLLGIEWTRQGLYDAYYQAELDHTWNARALDIYADLTATGSAVQGDIAISSEGQVQRNLAYKVTIDGENLPELDEINRRTKLPSRARRICRDFIRDGDRFDELIYQRGGLERLMKLPTESVQRLETEDGRLRKPYPFLQTKYDGKEIWFERHQIAHYRAGTPDRGYGVKNSLFWPLLTPSRELALIHSAGTLSRLTNPDGREVITVDTGDLKGKPREKFLKRAAAQYKQNRKVDGKGRVLTNGAVLTQTEPLFVAVSTKRPLSKITRLPGASGIRDIKDIEYKRDVLLAGLAVSKSAYGLPVPYAGRGAVTEQMKILQRSCRSYRDDFERVAMEVYLWGLLSYGVSWDWLSSRSIVFDWPTLTHEDDLNFMQLTLLRIEIAEAMQSNGWLPPDEVMIRYLGFHPDDAAALVDKSITTRTGEAGAVESRYVKSFPTPPRVSGFDERTFSRFMDELQRHDQTLTDRIEDVRTSLMESIYSSRHSHIFDTYSSIIN